MERVIEQFRDSGIKQIYLPGRIADNSKQRSNIVLYTHALEMGGAPMVLCELGRILMKKYNVFVVSPEDGVLHEMFTEAGRRLYEKIYQQSVFEKISGKWLTGWSKFKWKFKGKRLIRYSEYGSRG